MVDIKEEVKESNLPNVGSNAGIAFVNGQLSMAFGGRKSSVAVNSGRAKHLGGNINNKRSSNFHNVN